MDFDNAKENIQPLAAGRNASILHASLCVESSQELQAHRRLLEDAIRSYNGDDPLEPWYAYISWIEQSFPSGGKESGLEEVLTKCLSRFEVEERYYQDRRMVRLYIKFIDSHKNPTECYQQLFSAGIGTMISDFYISWAYCFDLSGNTRKADEIFKRGLACRAQPLDDLKEAHQHFGFSVAQRLIYQDDEDAKEDVNRQLQERRLALTSLRGHHRKVVVGSIRTGAAVKSLMPGTVQAETASSSRRNNSQVKVFKDENESPNVPPEEESATVPESVESKSVVRSIIDAARNQENHKEPGPWNKAHDKKKAGKLFGSTCKTNELGFNIHEDDQNVEERKPKYPPISGGDMNYDKPFKYPANWVNKNRTQPEWDTPVTIEISPDVRTFPQYNKCMLYPRPNMEFQPEELSLYYALKRRGISNAWTKRCDAVWSKHDITANVRQYPNFAKQSKPQGRTSIDEYYEPPQEAGLIAAFKQIYDSKAKEEFQFEELMLQRIKRNETNIKTTDMEETICLPSDRMQRRKSFFPVQRLLSSKSIGEKREEEDVKREEVMSAALKKDTPEKTELKKIDSPMAEEVVVHKNITELDQPQSKVATIETQSTEGLVAKDTPFAIYQDHDEDMCSVDFQFKTPAVPTASCKASNLPFEIHTDYSTSATAAQKPETSGGIFDADETCSTQTFNIFLKSQSVSTPKAPHKLAPRLFGTVLRELPVPTDHAASEQQTPAAPQPPLVDTALNAASPEDANNLIVAPYSPQHHKQLSTILETSEHGTTQGTHTTGASTKSTIISSPELECETNALPHTGLETLPEQSVVSANANVEQLMESLKLQTTSKDCEMVDLTKNQDSSTTDKLAATPANIRRQKGDGGGINFTIFEDHTETLEAKQQQQVGNFTRLEEREDTTGGYVVRPVRFQEDKTETISKMLVKFPEDKTETISKMLLAPPSLADKFEEDKTETIPNMPVNLPSLPVVNDLRLYDSFEFYLNTSPKCAKPATKCLQLTSFMADTASPVASVAKRFCDKVTPEMHSKLGFGTKSKTDQAKTKHVTLFEDELPKATGNSKSNLMDSFLPFEDFSIVQPTQVATKERLPPASSKKPTKNFKSIMHDSFVPDFSYIEETQPQMVKLTDDDDNVHSHPLSTSTNFSFKSIQPVASKMQFVEDISMVMDSQPVETETRWKRSRSSVVALNTQTSQVNKHMLTDSFVKDFSTLKDPSNLHLNISALPQEKVNTTIKFLNDSVQMLSKNDSLKVQPCDPTNKASTQTASSSFKFAADTSTSSTSKNQSKLLFLDSSKLSSKESKSPHSDPFSELNAETTEMFSTNISSIKNSTWLPQHEPSKRQSQIQEKSVHIKTEVNLPSNSFETSYTIFKSPPLPASRQKNSLPPVSKLSFLGGGGSFKMADDTCSRPSIDINSSELSLLNANKQSQQKTTNQASRVSTANQFRLKQMEKPLEQHTAEASSNSDANMNDDDDDCEMSIYYKKTPKTPKIQIHIWNDEEGTPPNNSYVHHEVDLNETTNVINNICVDPNVNPFNVDLRTAFLENISFHNYIENLPSCKLLRHISRLHPALTIKVHDVEFDVLKLVGEGAYGAVYCGMERKTRRKYALKQERPPNYWEYYICLEIQSRLQVDDLLPAFMSVDYALIGNNSSILLAEFSPYGSLINVCNTIKKHTTKNVDEYVVMHISCELLEIIDHLHAAGIIHADLKADNVLLMKKLTYPSTQRSLQLIDFGISIDMHLFKKGQTFSYVNKDNNFKCPEMREQRPWTYQLDLFSLAAVLHVLLFGKYMDMEKHANGYWMHKTYMPRYLNKALWDTIFKTLLNVRDCSSMPDLQQLRALLKEEIAEKEQYVIRKISEFNSALGN